MAISALANDVPPTKEATTSGDTEVFCPTETDKKPQMTFKKDSKTVLFICGEIDDSRETPPNKTWMTKIIVYAFKADGTPYSLFENDNPLRNFFASSDKNGLSIEEVHVLDQKPTPIFLTNIDCKKETCEVKTKCLRPFAHRSSTTISKKILVDSENFTRAESHLQSVFRSSLSGSPEARKLFHDEKFKEQLKSPLRDLYEKYESVLKSYAGLGC